MKRMFDLVIASVAMVLALPVIGLLALLIRACIGSPVFFQQRRPGLNGRSFSLLKFRTMMDLRDAEGNLRADEERLPAFGRVLRSTSLDELPELWNIIRGEMSLVGPRPLLEEYLPLYSAKHARRHEVRPGLTGWAQVNGRNASTWAERLDYDVWYVDNRTMALDLRILWRTVWMVIARTGVSAEGEATMAPYRGESHQP